MKKYLNFDQVSLIFISFFMFVIGLANNSLAFGFIITLYLAILYAFMTYYYATSLYYKKTGVGFCEKLFLREYREEYRLFNNMTSQVDKGAEFLFHVDATQILSKNSMINNVKNIPALDLVLITERGIFAFCNISKTGHIIGSDDSKVWTNLYATRYGEEEEVFVNPIPSFRIQLSSLHMALEEYKDVTIFPYLIFPYNAKIENHLNISIPAKTAYQMEEELRKKYSSSKKEFSLSEIGALSRKLEKYARTADKK